MKIFNLTDFPTDEMRAGGQDNIPVVFARRVINPGTFVEIEEEDSILEALRGYVAAGILSRDVLPPAYVVRKQRGR